MTAKRIQLAIDTPCQQRWQDMTPEAAGRFCDSCQKTVVDFVTMSDQQIADYFLSQPKHVCGRFTSTQLNRDLIVAQNTSNNFLKQRWLGLVATGLMGWSTVQGYPAKEVNKSALSDKILILTPVARDSKIETIPIAGDSTRVITGQVIDESSKSPAVGVNVCVKGSQLITQADAEGRFRLSVSYNQGADLVVVVSGIGFKTQELTVGPTRERPLVVFLNEDLTMLGEVVVTGQVSAAQKPTFWQRLRNRFRARH